MKLTASVPLALSLMATSSLFAQQPPGGFPAVADPAPVPAPAVPGAPAIPPAPGPEAPGASGAIPTPPRNLYAPARATNSRNRKVDVVLSEGSRAAAGNADIADANLEKANSLIKVLDDDLFLPRTTKTGRTLVIQSTELDPTALANAEEDLSVMALILRKATSVRGTEERRVAMGIELDGSVFGSSSGARNIYLEGYGALFLLGVRYPLVAPTDVIKENQPKASSDDDWSTAKREYLDASQTRFQVASEGAFTRQMRQAQEQYDAQKVEDLKTALLQALKNASHVRVLKPTDFITVVIQGGDVPRTEKSSPRAGSKSSRSETRAAETVMTLRVKAADAVAFSKGELELAALRQRAVIQTYLRRGDSSIGTAGFMGPAGQ